MDRADALYPRHRKVGILLENFTIATFSGHVGENFRIYPQDADPLEIELISATRLGEDPEPEGRPFSIVFRGPKDALLPQRIYRMEHEEIGAFDIFLVPIGPDEEGLLYEAIFN
jgi:hypothetical protein